MRNISWHELKSATVAAYGVVLLVWVGRLLLAPEGKIVQNGIVTRAYVGVFTWFDLVFLASAGILFIGIAIDHLTHKYLNFHI